MIMKILFYINAIHDGGAERVMVNLAKYFSDTGCETILVTSFRDTWEYKVEGNVKRLSLEEKEIKQGKIKRNFSRIIKLRDILKKEKPDVAVSFMAEPNFRLLIASLGLNVKTIVSVRNDPNREYSGRIGKLVGKWILPLADGCVFQTKEAQGWFPKRLQKKSTIIFNAVKEDFFHIERKPIEGEIVTCGRLEAQKNHKLLIDAFADVVKNYPYGRLKIYGEGSLREVLQEQIYELDLQDKAFLMGATNDVAKALQTADLFVLSSDYEGMPNALMEAMAAGVPCISTDCPCGGPRELLGSFSPEVLFKLNDRENLYIKINKMLGDKELKNEKGAVCKKVAEGFKSNAVFKSWEKYFCLVLAKRGM